MLAETALVRLGRRLKERRLALSLAQWQVAEEMGVAQSTLSQYELAHRSPPYAFLLRLCDYYKTDPNTLLLP